MTSNAQWAIDAFIALALAVATIVAVVIAYRQGKKSNEQSHDAEEGHKREEENRKLVKETEERTETRFMFKGITEKLETMDKSFNDKMTQILAQNEGTESCLKEYGQRITAVEESAKSAHKRIDEIRSI